VKHFYALTRRKLTKDMVLFPRRWESS